jgi:uncharacterized membrane protein
MTEDELEKYVDEFAAVEGNCISWLIVCSVPRLAERFLAVVGEQRFRDELTRTVETMLAIFGTRGVAVDPTPKPEIKALKALLLVLHAQLDAEGWRDRLAAAARTALPAFRVPAPQGGWENWEGPQEWVLTSDADFETWVRQHSCS